MLFHEAQSFPQALLLGTNNDCGQISGHIFMPNRGHHLQIKHCVYKSDRSLNAELHTGKASPLSKGQ